MNERSRMRCAGIVDGQYWVWIDASLKQGRFPATTARNRCHRMRRGATPPRSMKSPKSARKLWAATPDMEDLEHSPWAYKIRSDPETDQVFTFFKAASPFLSTKPWPTKTPAAERGLQIPIGMILGPGHRRPAAVSFFDGTRPRRGCSGAIKKPADACPGPVVLCRQGPLPNQRAERVFFIKTPKAELTEQSSGYLKGLGWQSTRNCVGQLR